MQDPPNDNDSEHDFNALDDNSSIKFPVATIHITRRYSPESFTSSIRTTDPYSKRPSTSITRAGNKTTSSQRSTKMYSSLNSNRPTSTKTRSRSQSQQLFQPQPPPRQISGPVFYYRKLNRIEQKERASHIQEIKRKAFNNNINSPFKQDMCQLRENSVKSSRRALIKSHQEWIKQRNKQNRESKAAIKEDFKKESRHCKKDHLSRSHPIVHILDLDS